MNQHRLLGDRYEVGEVLGRGGMATVRRGRDTRLYRDVAIKELRVDLASDTTFQERFRREAQSSASLNHPNIVAVYDTGEQTDAASGVSVPYIVMELIEGRTLRDILREGRALVPERAFEFTLGVLDALAYSHKAGIVHRDIKPANVMLTSSGRVKVMDFGIARAVADTSSTMTQTAAVIGTAQYLSPEQARGEMVDQRSDIYSAGCLLYELLVGKPPFSGDSPVSVAYQHVRELPTPPSQLDAELSNDVDTIVLKSLAKDPRDRYQSADEMATDIRRVLAGQSALAMVAAPAAGPATATVAMPAATAAVPTPAGRPSRALPVEPKPQRHWGLIAGIGVLVLGLIVGAILLLLPNNHQIAVPNVTKVQQGIAETRLKDKGLNAEVAYTQGPDDNTVGLVIEQSPREGTLVDANSTVKITINRGPDKKDLPGNMIGRDATQLKAELEQMGFTVKMQEVPPPTEPAAAKMNEVLRYTPSDTTKVSIKQEIVLFYASGKAVVPNLLTLSQDEASKQLKAAGFGSVKVLTKPSTSTPDRVVSQEPLAFSIASKTDTITFYIAAPVATPSVVTVTPTKPSPSPSVGG